MAFIASQLPLQRGFEQALNTAFQEKQILANWYSQLAGNITGIDAMNMLANLNRVLIVFNEVAALPNIGPYVQNQFGNASYNVTAEFTAMVNALTDISTWLKTNIPANAVSIVNGELTGSTYTQAQTSPLRSLIAAAQLTIN